jgi:hypothetical protein
VPTLESAALPGWLAIHLDRCSRLVEIDLIASWFDRRMLSADLPSL